MTIEPTAAENRSTRSGTTVRIDRWIRTPLSALAFWSAILLPVLYVPLFVSGFTGLAPFLALLTLHSIALIGGREYKRGE